MIKALLVIVVLFSQAYPLSKFTWFWNVRLSGDTVTVVKMKTNYDRVKGWSDTATDTINTLPRENWFSNHVKIFPWMNIDTIGGKVIMDTVKIDSIQTRTTKYTGLVFASSGDSCMILKNGVPTLITAANLRVMIGAASTVQLADSCATKMTRINAAGDTLTLTKGVSATIGRFTGALFGTSGTFTGTVGVDSLRSTKGVSGTYGRFSSVLWGDSLSVTKGISATIGRFTGALFGTSATFTGNISTSSGSSVSGGTVFASTSISAPYISASGGTVYADSIMCNLKLLYARKGVTTNIRDTLTYEDTTFYDSLYFGITYHSRGIARLIKVGNVIHLYQPYLHGTLEGMALSLKGVPSKYLPNSLQQVPTLIKSSGSVAIGVFEISNISGVKITLPDLSTPIGDAGIMQTSVSWIK